MKKLIIFLIVVFSTIVCTEISAQTKQSWEIICTYEVPFEAQTVSIMTDDGDVKHYLIVDNEKIFIKDSSFEKFKNKEQGLVLVEWYNIYTNKYKYTVRLAEKKEQNKLTINWNNKE